MNTTAIVAAILIGSLLISAGIFFRKNDFQSCLDATEKNLIANGSSLEMAESNALSLCRLR